MSFSYKPNTISWFYYNHSGLLNDLCESSVGNHFIKKVDNVYLINTKPQRFVSNTAQRAQKGCLYPFEIMNTVKNYKKYSTSDLKF